MDLSQKLLSDIVVYNKYARYLPDLQRRECWEDLCDRNMTMHIRKYPHLKKEIIEVYQNYVIPKKVLPSMRSMQFGGRPIEVSNVRIYNCSFLPMDDQLAFSELMFLLLSGVGVGYSVRKKVIGKLPIVKGPNTSGRRRRFLVGDSIEGWADAIKVLVKSYFEGKADIDFDFRDIRAKGAQLITAGGKAPGPDPLRICIDHLRSVLNGSIGRQLTSIEVHDMCCHIADSVLSGGIRRSACIVGFDIDDNDMLSSKTDNWWELNPQRGRANNSVVLDRRSVTKEQFQAIWEKTKASGSGEPGFYWTSSEEGFTNPCVETFLNPHQFCNLTEINAIGIITQEEFNNRARAAAFLGTLQAGYSNFHYLRDVWQETTEREALLGVGITGIANHSFIQLDSNEAAQHALQENSRVASLIGINEAARVTVVKPSGTTSCVVGSSSGIHAWHAPFYIRRMRIGKTEPIYKYLVDRVPGLIEDCIFKPHLEAVLSIPQRAPADGITRDESTFDLLARVKQFNENWIRSGHRYGENYSNVSVTVSIKENEWDSVGEWMWENRDSYTGISVLPYDGHTYQQAPFETCSEEEFNRLFALLQSIDLTEIVEHEDATNLNDQAACAGGNCEIT